MTVVGERRIDERWFVCLLALVPIALALLALYVRPAMDSDPANGFLVLDAMKHGAPFNMLVLPSSADIANDTRAFLSWWSRPIRRARLVESGLDLGRHRRRHHLIARHHRMVCLLSGARVSVPHGRAMLRRDGRHAMVRRRSI